MKTEAWECEHCGQLFKENEYVEHALKVLTEKAKDEAIATLAQNKKETLNEPRLTSRTWEEYAKKLELAVNQFQKQQISEIKFSNLGYGQIPNTHDCPVGGERNWWQHDTDKKGNKLPTSYPGWSGTVTYKLTPCSDYNQRLEFGTFGLKDTGFNLGSGGGGDRCNYSVKLFEADFPLIKEQREIEEEWQTWSSKECVQAQNINYNIIQATLELSDIEIKINQLQNAITVLNQSKVRWHNQIDAEQKLIKEMVAGRRQGWEKTRGYI